MIRSTLTDRWQTTIPAAIRKALRLKPRQRLTYELVDGGVLIRPEPETPVSYYGCLGDGTPAATKDQERQAVRDARVGRYTHPQAGQEA